MKFGSGNIWTLGYMICTLHEVPGKFQCFSWEAILSMQSYPELPGTLASPAFAGSNRANQQTASSRSLKLHKSCQKHEAAKHLSIAAILQLKKNLWNWRGNEDKNVRGANKNKQTFWVSRTASSTMPLWLWKSRKRCWREDPVQYLLHEMKDMLIFPRISCACILFTLIHFQFFKCQERRPANSKFFSEDPCISTWSQSNNSASSVAMAKGSRSRAAVHAVAAQPLRPLEPRVLNGPLAHKVEWLKFVMPLGNTVSF